ncbi:hypothetical protein ACPPVW_14420 [Leifsonia sp. McL0607]|uniref:hypothetical protein n=1 Tax=Leifsonia sp. McL0607 TaxID=3415672 RepID=UPI003CF1F70E
MRFVLAIVAFVVAAVMIVAGIAQRTIFAPPSQLAVSATVGGDARYIVIDSVVLNAHPGQQTLSIAGATDATTQMVAYGRTADVKAWLGDQKYAAVSYRAGTGELAVKTVTPKAADTGSSDGSTPAPTAEPTAAPPAGSGSAATAPGPDPAGSDLWLAEYDGQDAQTIKMNVPTGVSVIIASDGTKPAPNKILLTWPVDTSTPWAFPLIIGGLVLLVIGIALYLWGLYTHRKSRGPRRTSGPKMPQLPKAPKYKPTTSIEATPRGRRASRRTRVMVPAVLAGVLALTGVGAGAALADGPTGTPTPTTTTAPKGDNQPPPAVTVAQLARIVKRISVAAADADSKGDPALAKLRFTGPALQLRDANYAIRAKKADQPALPAIPADPPELSLPQATDSWPRTVTAVLKMPNDAAGKAQAPLALALVQQTPRDNYMVEYAIALEPNVKVPNLAPASIGAAVVPPDSKLLKIQPNEIAAAYGDILLNGDQSKWLSSFDLTDDKLVAQVGASWKQQEQARLAQQFGNTSSLTFTSRPGTGPVISMATNDSGAIVWVNPEEVQLHKVQEAGAQVIAGATTAALSGIAQSNTGIESVYGYQLAFYVPPAGSSEKVRLLGFSQGLVSAREVQ